MGGIWYQKEAREIVDYDLFRLGDSDEWFRGPRFDLSKGRYITFLGAAQTFGTFVRYPFPAIVAERMPTAVLNLGIGGAGPGRFLMDQPLIDCANEGRLAVVQVMSGRSAENSEYEVLDGCSSIRRRGTNENWRFAEAVWEELHQTRSSEDVARLIHETQQDWLEKMQRLLSSITVPKMLLWISGRSPNVDAKPFSSGEFASMRTFPHFVDENMLNDLKSQCEGFVDATSLRGLPQALSSKATGAPTSVDRAEGGFTYQSGYPSPEMHEEIASRLIPEIRRVLNEDNWVSRLRRSSRTESLPRLKNAPSANRYDAMRDHRVVILLSHERSGSNMLKSIFGKSKDVYFFPEVFNYIGNKNTYGADYFSFMRDYDRKAIFFEPNLDNISKVIQDYFDYLIDVVSKEDKKTIVVDIKYRNMCLLSGGVGGAWHFPPGLQVLSDLGVKIIHLYRRDVFASCCSAHLAYRSGVYNDYENEGLDSRGFGKISVDKETLFQECLGLAAEIISWKRWLSVIPNVQIEYEDIVFSRKIITDISIDIENLIGIKDKLIISEPTTRKISDGPESYLENYTEFSRLHRIFADVNDYQKNLFSQAFGSGGH